MHGGDAPGGGAGRCAGPPPDKTIINRIMLKFRPIAPKPTSGSAGSSGSRAPEAKNGFVGLGKRKRRYVRVSATKRNSNNSRKQNKYSSGASKEKKEGTRSDKDEVKTLCVVPDESAYPRRTEHPPANKQSNSESPGKYSKAEKEAMGVQEETDLGPSDLTMAEIQRPRMEAVVTAESWVTVLSLTDACMDGGELGCTDEDRWRTLGADTFPGFISDADNHVLWSNTAYRKMVAGGEEAAAAKMSVTLVVKEWLPMMMYPAFACMVRVQYTWQKERDGEDERNRRGGGKTVVVPCDVWRMSYGGFAWRLDLKAGLSLGL